MGFTLLKKIWPYLLLVVLGLVLYGGFRYFTNKVEELTQQNTILQTQNAEVNNNYTTLQNMYSISMKQVEELQKQQKESLEYVTELRIALNEIDLEKAYETDKDGLLKTINDYEKCYARNLIKNPTIKCYVKESE